MNAVSKAMIACSIAAASMFSPAAYAAPSGMFEVNPVGAYENFEADRIVGKYVETITFDGTGGFDVSLRWTAGQFDNSTSDEDLFASRTGLGNSYSLYATYTSKGTVTMEGEKTVFNFTPGSADLNLYLKDLLTAGPDVLLASGKGVSGEGSLDPNLTTCGDDGINCGSFGSKTTFELTTAGSNFFVAPDPFYIFSFQSGQLNTFPTEGSQTIRGSVDVVFDTQGEVPEPASVGLLGLGMLGLYAARRRNKKAA